MAEVGMKEGYDVGLEMSGSSHAFTQLIDAMNNGGRVALLGILPNETMTDWNAIIFKGLFLKGIYGREMFETWYKMATLVQSGLDLTPLITHRYPIDDYLDGFETMLSGQSGKVILEWS